MPSLRCSMKWTLGFLPYVSQEWRDGRKIFQREFHANAVKRYQPIEMDKVYSLLRQLLQSPDDFWNHIQRCVQDMSTSTQRLQTFGCRMAAGLMTTVAYGTDLQTGDDPMIATVEHAMDSVRRAGVPGTYLVDTLPIRTCSRHKSP